MPYEIPDGRGNRDEMLEPEFWFRAGADDAKNGLTPRDENSGSFRPQYDDGFEFGVYLRRILTLESM